MSKLPIDQLKIRVSNAGFRQGDADIMTAIILAESGGDPNAVSPPNKDGSRDYGLAQINSVHFGQKIDNGILGTGVLAGRLTKENVLDPQINLAYAQQLYRAHGGANSGTRFNDWTTYKSKSYLQFLPKAQATPGVETTPSQDRANEGDVKAYGDALKDSVLSPQKWADAILAPLREGAKSVGAASLGLVLVVLGIAILISTSKVGKRAVKRVIP